jgi:hypothetical protein
VKRQQAPLDIVRNLVETVPSYSGGTLYLVRPGYNGENGEDVIDAFDHARGNFEAAMELARLAGLDDRAAQIKQVLLRAYSRQPRVLNRQDIDELLALLDGLEDKLVGPVVDKNWLVRPEQLPELRKRTTTLELEESRGDTAIHGVSEGMARIAALRFILQKAKDANLDVAVS